MTPELRSAGSAARVAWYPEVILKLWWFETSVVSAIRNWLESCEFELEKHGDVPKSGSSEKHVEMSAAAVGC